MRVLLGFAASLAAIAIPAAPAQAEATSGSVLTAVPGGVTVHRGGPRHFGRDRDGMRRDDRRDRRDHRRFDDGIRLHHWVDTDDRTFDHDSYNDWWHERPWRSYPRWVQNNANCERMWRGGGVWRCGW